MPKNAYGIIESVLEKLQRIKSEKKEQARGFTIVELLIVVVIIGILAAIVVVAYNGITDAARASAIADGFKKFEKAMRLYVVDQGYATWPIDNVPTGGGNPNIGNLVSSASGFSAYMQSAPTVSGVSASDWRYDFDGDAYNGCSASNTGVNVYIGNFSDTAMAQRVDDAVDDGNLSCGSVRLQGSNFLYGLSNDGAL